MGGYIPLLPSTRLHGVDRENFTLPIPLTRNVTLNLGFFQILWRALFNTVVNLRPPHKAKHFLPNGSIIARISRRTLLHKID